MSADQAIQMKSTPINQLPGGGPPAGGGQADPLVQNILNDYDNQGGGAGGMAGGPPAPQHHPLPPTSDQLPQIPETAEEAYQMDQDKYREQQFGLDYENNPQFQQGMAVPSHMDIVGAGEGPPLAPVVQQPFYKRWLPSVSMTDVYKALLVAGLFFVMSFKIVDVSLIKYIPRVATIVDGKLVLNIVGIIVKSLLAGLLFFIVGKFL